MRGVDARRWLRDMGRWKCEREVIGRGRGRGSGWNGTMLSRKPIGIDRRFTRNRVEEVLEIFATSRCAFTAEVVQRTEGGDFLSGCAGEELIDGVALFFSE